MDNKIKIQNDTWEYEYTKLGVKIFNEHYFTFPYSYFDLDKRSGMDKINKELITKAIKEKFYCGNMC